MAEFARAVTFDAERLIGRLQTYWLLFLAYAHLSNSAVCSMSQGRSMAQGFHTKRDASKALPNWAMVATCRRCGKEYWIK